MTTLTRPALRQVRSRVFDSAPWADYRAREGDIVIATYPKCGTTWTQRIVSMLLSGDAAPAPAWGPWPDFRLGPPPEVDRAQAEAMTGRRYFKSHLPYDALPVWAGVKFIHTARDGRDAAMSFHNHLIGFQEHMWGVIADINLADPKFGDAPPPIPPAAGDYFGVWLQDAGGAFGDAGAGYWEMERSYWAARAEPSMLLVHYNDLKADRAGEIARIARFLEVDWPAATMAEIVRAAGFDEMKAAGDAIVPEAKDLWVGGSQTFLNKGTNGRWKDAVSAADLAAYEARVKAEFTPALAAWLEGGRLVAGDPAGAGD